MRKCRITVLKRTFDAELAVRYANPQLGPCQRLKEGAVFYADWEKPDGFCNEAWKAIQHYVMTLSHDGGNFYSGSWLRDPNIAICSCNDGIRPVIFLIERVTA